MTDTSREALIAMMRDYAYEGDTWVLQQEAADMLEADGKPKNFLRLRGQLEQEWADVRALKEANKPVAQQVAVPASDLEVSRLYHASSDSFDFARKLEAHHGIGAKP